MATRAFLGARPMVPQIRPETVSCSRLLPLDIPRLPLTLKANARPPRSRARVLCLIMCSTTGILIPLPSKRAGVVLTPDSASNRPISFLTCRARLCTARNVPLCIVFLSGRLLTTLRQFRNMANGACNLRSMPVKKPCCVFLSRRTRAILCVITSNRPRAQGTM